MFAGHHAGSTCRMFHWGNNNLAGGIKAPKGEPMDLDKLNDWAVEQSVQLEDRLSDLYQLRQMVRYLRHVGQAAASGRISQVYALAKQLGFDQSQLN